ncbi:NAD(P)-dependent oxidoreductase [Spiroplasma culicicola]|uniref:Putative NADH-flavin reductase n=1 Tax=Spiroplasma culicicola AES-1 TaxID=1276246 RepID=W6A704_9MOLU|nr:NAD(P)H-binding protein [Spiroplasma culicicola]AHI52918.1 putative NADH-flavin reductase [Spiroplasma culicicola AES-1]
MKILHIGYQGKLGTRLSNELTNRKIETIKFEGDALNYQNLLTQAQGVDIIVSTVGANSVEDFETIAKNVIKIATDLNIRVLWSGGAATLIQKDGTRIADLDINTFPEELKGWIPAVYGHAKVLDLFKASPINWTFMSPALDFQDIEPIGDVKVMKTDEALYNSQNNSFASYISGAKALADELENPRYLNSRFTIVEEG